MFTSLIVALASLISLVSTASHAQAPGPLADFGVAQQQEKYSGVTSLLVSQHNELLFEAYFEGANKSTLHNTRSATKTLVAILSGIAIDQGQLSSAQDPIIALFSDKFDSEEVDPRKLAITFEDMLTMI